MKKPKCITPAFLGLLVFCAGVWASEHTVDVTTEVPVEIVLVQADGSALESDFHLKYSAENGVEPLRIPFRVISNSSDNNLALNLKEAARLERKDSNESIPLNVFLDGQQMGIGAIQARGRYVDPYPNVLDAELVISIPKENARLAKGLYFGTVALRVTSSTSSL